MSQSIQDRLNDCKQFLLDEQRSKKPSKLYIGDLESTIKWLEQQMSRPAFAMMVIK